MVAPAPQPQVVTAPAPVVAAPVPAPACPAQAAAAPAETKAIDKAKQAAKDSTKKTKEESKKTEIKAKAAAKEQKKDAKIAQAKIEKKTKAPAAEKTAAKAEAKKAGAKAEAAATKAKAAVKAESAKNKAAAIKADQAVKDSTKAKSEAAKGCAKTQKAVASLVKDMEENDNEHEAMECRLNRLEQALFGFSNVMQHHSLPGPSVATQQRIVDGVNGFGYDLMDHYLNRAQTVHVGGAGNAKGTNTPPVSVTVKEVPAPGGDAPIKAVVAVD